MKNLHVISLGNGWAVKNEGSDKITLITDTKSKAVKIAKDIAINNLSDLIIHGRDGKIQQRDSYGKGSYHYNLELGNSRSHTLKHQAFLWKEYIAANRQFSILYRSDFLINRNFIYGWLGPKKNIKGVSFGVPEQFIGKKNLNADSFISVEWMNNEKGTCKAKSFLNSVEERGEKRIGKLEYDYAKSWEAGMGHIHEETVFSCNSGKLCFGIRLFLHSTNIKFFEPGLIKEFDKKSLEKIYMKMIKSFNPFPNIL